MYGAAIDQVIGWLEKAIQVAENKNQEEALKLLITYYKTGSLDVWDQYCIAWATSTEGNIDWINGFIEVYNDPNLDWLVMLSNNYINYETEWPLTNSSFEKYLLYKYGTYENINKGRYYETGVIRDSLSNIIVPPGKVVPGDYSITFFDRGLNQLVTKSNLITVTNLDYENQIQDKRRNIFVLKATYVGLVIDDLEALMPYKKGSTQYLNDKTVRGNNIRLYS